MDFPSLSSRSRRAAQRAGRPVRAWLLGAALLAGLGLPGCGGGGDAPAGALDVATDATYPPFESVDEQTKELVGFDMDLIRELAKRAGLQIRLQNSGFDALLAGIGSCQYDAAISSITITPDRQASMRFTEPYFLASQRIAVRSDAQIQARTDLAGKLVGAQIGTTGALEVGKIEGATLKTYDELNQAFQDLLNGQIDAVIADNVPTLGYIAKNAERLRATPDVFSGESYGIAVCAEQPELQEKLNAALTALREDGTLAELQRRWGLELPSEPSAGGSSAGR